MKKFLTLFTVIFIILATTAILASCGGDDVDKTDTGAVTTVETVESEGEATDSNNGNADSEEQTSETDNGYYDGIPDDTADDIVWTNNY